VRDIPRARRARARVRRNSRLSATDTPLLPSSGRRVLHFRSIQRSADRLRARHRHASLSAEGSRRRRTAHFAFARVAARSGNEPALGRRGAVAPLAGRARKAAAVSVGGRRGARRAGGAGHQRAAENGGACARVRAALWTDQTVIEGPLPYRAGGALAGVSAVINSRGAPGEPFSSESTRSRSSWRPAGGYSVAYS
jgi:hypothetical protein